MIIITIVSTKGGVGKTTVTANLGGLLADSGYRVLLIDADPQPTLSSYFILEERSEYGLTHFLIHSDSRRVISRTTIENLDIVLSDDPGGKLRDWIRDTPDGRVRLKHNLSQLDNQYDFVLLDTQGSVGPLQDAAVTAADFMLSPIPPEILSAKEFVRGTVNMIQRLQPMARLGAPIGPLRGVIYRQDRTVDARIIAEELRCTSFTPSKGAITILETVIPSSVVYREAATMKIPVHRIEQKTSTGKNAMPSAKETMVELARELIPNLPDLA